ncbi:molybdenum cofactor sulfurase, putative [Talaromyces stipitatus ATCC 10500]|uniref:Molybdenum cofactor sulfurase, putative n=1 Tax=Talaromyces stipitatus (strain ATCC 10500 / CBS 375.48 / QM 6759 / NRRL 1006) TaxID=441959 RepID=B8MJ03_TALSN|nr:molybdenum cofactor sulfurase, putative [Talaromyces stipitatus ATCC 10500]EED15665.1 molybdenum cofactor sulfurase, putative [Talaromyces stipitatus ATCC 10500]
MYDINKIRRKEYPGLNKTCYLDYGGATPYAKSLIDISAKLWKSDLLGNPHSKSASSLRSTEYVNQARQHVLDFFRADPDDFDIVFVANATAAIKLVANCFQEKGFWYGYHTDAHTSLVGVRELADKGYHCFSSDKSLDEWIESPHLHEDDDFYLPNDLIRKDNTNRPVLDSGFIKLIGYPAQSNMNGHRTPKKWAKRIRQKGHANREGLYTLLDAAAFCSSAQLDLSDPDAAPDFVSVSFYKIFGMPDLGALIVRRKSSEILLSRQYFGGGTVDMVTAFDHFHAKKIHHVHEVLEDGTLPFHNLVMLDTGIVLHHRLFHSMDEISNHASHLALQLYTDLSRLKHANGKSVCKIYKDENSIYGDSDSQGPTVAFTVRKSNGAWVHYDYFEALASACNIQIRTGGVCNPGGIAEHLELASWELRRNYCEGYRCGEPFRVRGGKPSGIIRASLGAMSNRRDVETLVAFVKHFFVDYTRPQGYEKFTGRFPEKEQQPWFVKKLQIFPIQHFPSCSLPISSSWELNYSRLALDGEWCLVDLKSNKVRKECGIASGLMVEINSELTLLRLARSASSQVSSMELDLWELPTGNWVTDSLEQTFQGAYRLARTFTSKTLEEFFTSAFGQPTTLARFHEFKGELPVDVCVEKVEHRRPSGGIVVQFSGDVPLSNVHMVLGRTPSVVKSNEDLPQQLQFGSQLLFHSPATKLEEYNMYRCNIARYCRAPDADEDLVSQNTTINPIDLVLESHSSLTKDRQVDNRDYHFCPVVGCHEKNVDYFMLLHHLRGHASSFMKSRRRRCWFRRK